MTVYVITRGDYSAYEICGVTLDKNRAEKMAKFYSDSLDKATIEEYETDTEDSDTLDNLIPVYWVRINRKGEFLVKVDRYTDGRKLFTPSFSLTHHILTGEPFFVATLTAKDKEHALKIAFDERAKQIAEKYGVV
jgi:hypothetical protein